MIWLVCSTLHEHTRGERERNCSVGADKLTCKLNDRYPAKTRFFFCVFSAVNLQFFTGTAI